jgi:hypothetical protein
MDVRIIPECTEPVIAAGFEPARRAVLPPAISPTSVGADASPFAARWALGSPCERLKSVGDGSTGLMVPSRGRNALEALARRRSRWEARRRVHWPRRRSPRSGRFAARFSKSSKKTSSATRSSRWRVAIANRSRTAGASRNGSRVDSTTAESRLSSVTIAESIDLLLRMGYAPKTVF